MSSPAPADHELAKVLATLCPVTGEFILRSGRTVTTYFDKFRFEAEPEVLRSVASTLAPLVPDGIEVLAGLELGGVPVATALSLETGIAAAFVRKVAKKHGTANLVEGADVAGRSVLAVEDVITTGGQVATSVEELRAVGADVEAVLCVIDRRGGDHARLEAADVEVLSLFRAEDVDRHAGSGGSLRVDGSSSGSASR